jgi:hypothetical protein
MTLTISCIVSIRSKDTSNIAALIVLLLILAILGRRLRPALAVVHPDRGPHSVVACFLTRSAGVSLVISHLTEKTAEPGVSTYGTGPRCIRMRFGVFGRSAIHPAEAALGPSVRIPRLLP